jgi:hypothetical protein
MKGDDDRGIVLGATDEITLLVDDNAMGLQSMAASRFVAPFAESVHDWEKKLSNVAEVIDVWIIVQRKWMYLEGIFLAGDIRQQLRTEAGKFDVIHAAFKVNSASAVLICFVGSTLLEVHNLLFGVSFSFSALLPLFFFSFLFFSFFPSWIPNHSRTLTSLSAETHAGGLHKEKCGRDMLR